MTYIGQMLLEAPTTDGKLARAVADAFGVHRVAVWPMSQVLEFEAGVIVQYAAQRGDFPVLLRITAMPGSGIETKLSDEQFIERLRSIARSLDQFVLTDDAGVDPFQYEDFLLVAPDGKTIVVVADEDALNENRIELTPASQGRRDDLARHVAAASA